MGRKTNPTLVIIGTKNAGKTTLIQQITDNSNLKPDHTSPYLTYYLPSSDFTLTILEISIDTTTPQELLEFLKKKKYTSDLQFILIQDITTPQTNDALTQFINALHPKLKSIFKHNYTYVFGHKIDLLTIENERITKIKFKNAFTTINPPHVHIAFTSQALPLPNHTLDLILANEPLPETHTSLTQLPLQSLTQSSPEQISPETPSLVEQQDSQVPTDEIEDITLPSPPQKRTDAYTPQAIAPSLSTKLTQSVSQPHEAQHEQHDQTSNTIWPITKDIQESLLKALNNTNAVILDPSEKIGEELTSYTVIPHLENPLLATITLPFGNHNINITYAAGIRTQQLITFLTKLPSIESIPVYLIHHTKDPASRIDTLSLLQTIENQRLGLPAKLWITIYPVTSADHATTLILEAYQFDDTLAQDIQQVIEGFTSAFSIHELIGMTLTPYIGRFAPLIELQSSLREFEEDTLVPYIHLISTPYVIDIEYQNEDMEPELIQTMKHLFNTHAFDQTQPQKEYTENEVSVIIQKVPPLSIAIGYPVKHKLLYTDVIQYIYEDLQLLAEEWKNHFDTLYTTIIQPKQLTLPPSELSSMLEQTEHPPEHAVSESLVPSSPSPPKPASEPSLEHAVSESLVPSSPSPPKPTTKSTKLAILYPFFKATGEPVIPELHEQPQLKTTVTQLRDFLASLSKKIVETPFTTTIDLEEFKIHLRTGEELGIALITNFNREPKITQRILTRALVHTALYVSKTIQTPQDKKRLLQALEKLYTTYLNPPEQDQS